MEEIQTSRTLAEEAEAMRHCVYSYRPKIENGWSSIWSLRRETERMLTVKADNRGRSIIQARGKFNRHPTSAELGILARRAKENSLSVRM